MPLNLALMQKPIEPGLTKWPFFLGDALLLGAAGFVYHQSKPPMGLWEMALAVGCVAAGAILSIVPFLLEHRAAVKLVEAGMLTSVVSQIQNLEAIAGQISGATGRWQDVQDGAEKTSAAAKGIADRMTAEAKAFTEFMQRANDTEKATLRLEAEKLRRAETEWLQVLVRLLDHTYALHSGALRSGQPNLIEQLGNFQNACREAARRVGLTPFAATPAEPFDTQRHQVLEGNGAPSAGAVVAETIASGYTFQGRLLRPALVRLDGNGKGSSRVEETPIAETPNTKHQAPEKLQDSKP
ncbi:MAG TPA: nucleotide exchange factor GrpE [Candidatus Binatia bacterium]|jgi:molecular chaperone GrpE (heat shock protein)|nr:nucleotide exchange factor GrpE [Candidatus Binatia bacterium]